MQLVKGAELVLHQSQSESRRELCMLIRLPDIANGPRIIIIPVRLLCIHDVPKE
jgi:hypothetical protein